MRYRNPLLALACVSALTLSACAGEGDPDEDEATDAAAEMADDADVSVEGGGVLVEGWMARTDEDAPLDDVRFVEADGGYEVNVGPAVVLYEPGGTASGTYTARTTFTQLNSKGHAHGAGLVIGGADLGGPDQAYTYFLVRGDGHFIVKTRTGATTAELSQGTDGPWVAHEAIQQEDADGRATNELAIQVGAESTVFMVNGTEVYRAPTADLYTDGVYGVRLNHNLDMRFDGVSIESGM